MAEEDIDEKYRYFSDSTIGVRLGNYRLKQKMAASTDAASVVSPPDPPAWTLRDGELASNDKYYFFGGYMPSPARIKGKSRPAIYDGPQTFTATNWNDMLSKRLQFLSEREKLTGIRQPPDTSYSRVHLNWRDEAIARRLAQQGRMPERRSMPTRLPHHTGAGSRQPISMAKSESQGIVSDSNGVDGMRQSIRHIFPQGHMTYDQLFKQPWCYNDQMRVTGTTHTKYPLEKDC